MYIHACMHLQVVRDKVKTFAQHAVSSVKQEYVK